MRWQCTIHTVQYIFLKAGGFIFPLPLASFTRGVISRTVGMAGGRLFPLKEPFFSLPGLSGRAFHSWSDADPVRTIPKKS